MPASAVAKLPDDQPAPQATRERRIPKRIRQAIHLIATGEVKTQKAAAKRVGVTPQHLCKMLARDNIRVFMARESARTIAGAGLRAANRLVELIDADSEHVAAQVSERILTSEGILKSDQRATAVNVDVKVGYILDLREDTPPLTPQQRTIEAKPLIEQASHSPSGPTDDE